MLEQGWCADERRFDPGAAEPGFLSRHRWGSAAGGSVGRKQGRGGAMSARSGCGDHAWRKRQDEAGVTDLNGAI